MKSIVLASSNPGKLREIAMLLDGCGLALRPQSDFGLHTPPEDGAGFPDNAMIKARYACARTGLATVAEDSGLEVDALGGEPGVRSARYAGEGADAAANLRLLLERVRAFPEKRLTARFRCAAVYIEPGGAPVVTEAAWEGRLVKSPQGGGGFGYDPVFFVADHGCTAAELSPETKNRISHRARAFVQLRPVLSGLCSGAGR